MEISRSDIEEMESRLIDGIINNDLDFLDKVLHDDLLSMAPNGQIITKEMDMNSHRQGTMVVDELIPEIEQIQIIGDVAIVIITYLTKGKMFGTPIEGKFKYNRIWKRCGNELKVISVSCMQV
jgi:ketosteroid isomerase-like protein